MQSVGGGLHAVLFQQSIQCGQHIEVHMHHGNPPSSSIAFQALRALSLRSGRIRWTIGWLSNRTYTFCAPVLFCSMPNGDFSGRIEGLRQLSVDGRPLRNQVGVSRSG